MLSNHPIGAGIIAVRAQALLWDHDRPAEFFASLEQPELNEVAGRPIR